MVKVVAVFLSTIVLVLSLQGCEPIEPEPGGSIKILSVNREIGTPATPDKFWTIFIMEVAYVVKNCDYGGYISADLVIDACNPKGRYIGISTSVAEGEGTITLRSRTEVMACESGRIHIGLFGQTDRYRYYFDPSQTYYYEKVLLDSDEIDY